MPLHLRRPTAALAALVLPGLLALAAPATAAPAPQATGQLVGELATGRTLTVDPSAAPAPAGDAPVYRGVFRFGSSTCSGAGERRAAADATTVTVPQDALFTSDVGAYYALSWDVAGSPVSGQCYGPVQRGFSSLSVDYSPAQPAQGVELTATGSVSPDTDLNGTTRRSYAWFLDGRQAGTGPTFTPTADAAGQELVLTVTATRSGYADQTASTEPRRVPQKVIGAPAPTIDDTTPAVGQLLTASDGFGAAPRPDGLSTTYRWGTVADDATCTVAGAASPTHRVVRAELGRRLCVVSSLSAPGHDPESHTSAPTEAVVAGTFTVRPTIDDTTPVVGQKLTASPGTDDAGVSVTYRWGRDDAGECNLLDDGSAGATYTVRAADLASRLCVRGSYSSTGYEPATRTSDPTAAVARGTLAPVVPTIDDTTPTFGDVLTATQPRDGLPAEAQASFRWGTVSGTGASATCTTAGDPGVQHTVTAGEVGARLCVVSTVSADGYTSGTATSAPTSAAVEASLDAPTPTVVNTSRTGGAPRIDDVLEARTDTTGLPAGTRVDLAWGRLTGTGANATCTPTGAAGSTGTKYTVTAADGGSSVCVVATASRTGHTTDRASSAGTPVVLKRVGALTTPMVTGGSSAPRPGELLQVARPATAPQDATVTVAWGRVRGGACVANGATGSSYRVTVADLGRSLCATTTVGGPAYEKDVSVVSTRQALVTERARLAVDDRTVVGRQKVAVRGYGLRPGQTYRLLALGRVVERGTVAANGRYVGTYRFPSSTASHPGRAIRLVVSDASGRRTFDATVKVTYRR
jgi:hypothetical protein